jgi:hypothetical protein
MSKPSNMNLKPTLIKPIKLENSKIGRFQPRMNPNTQFITPRIVITEHVKLEQGFSNLNIISKLSKMGSFRKSPRKPNLDSSNSISTIESIETLSTGKEDTTEETDEQNDDDKLYAKVYLNKNKPNVASSGESETTEPEETGTGFTNAKSIVNQSIDTIKESINNFKKKFSKTESNDLTKIEPVTKQVIEESTQNE